MASSTPVCVPAMLNEQTLHDFHAEVAAAGRIGRPVVLSGGGDGVFCNGMDLADAGDGSDRAKRGLLSFADCLLSIRWAAVPTIAAVDGSVLGGGVGIAAACDLTVATARSSFGLPEALYGLLPAVVMPLLLERVSPQQARLLALRGGSVAVEQAFRMGLVDQVVGSVDELETEVRRGVRELSRIPRAGVATVKQLLESACGAPMDQALCDGASISAGVLRTPAVQDAISEFIADGVPPWQER